MVCIQSKCGEIPTRKTPNTGTLHAWLMAFLISLCLLQFIWWLSIIVITAIFTLLSHRLLVEIHDNNFRTTLYQALRWSCCATRLALKLLCYKTCAEVAVLTLRCQRRASLPISLLSAFFMSMLFLCWTQAVKLRCELRNWVLCGVNIGMERVKYLSLLLIFFTSCSREKSSFSLCENVKILSKCEFQRVKLKIMELIKSCLSVFQTWFFPPFW